MLVSPRHSYSDENESAIIEVIEQYPGLGLRELARELQISPQSLKYYTDKLLQDGQLSIKKDGKYSRFYGKDVEIEDFEEKILTCFRKPHLLNVIMVFLDASKKRKIEALKNHDLLAKLDDVHSAGTITYYINQLIECEIIEKNKDGFHLKNKTLIERLLKKYNPTPSIIDNFINLWSSYFE